MARPGGVRVKTGALAEPSQHHTPGKRRVPEPGADTGAPCQRQIAQPVAEVADRISRGGEYQSWGSVGQDRAQPLDLVVLGRLGESGGRDRPVDHGEVFQVELERLTGPRQELPPDQL